MVMPSISRRKTPTVLIDHIPLGSAHPVVIQSMTDTPTADAEATYHQTVALIGAGAEIVRWTVNDDAAAATVPAIIRRLRAGGCVTPIVGDFHFNGHELLKRFPECAKSLSKYRINPGNIGRGESHDQHFEAFIRIAQEYGKPVRIGVNGGSLDQDVLASLMDENARSDSPKNPKEIIYDAMVRSALDSAAYAEQLGLGHDKIVLSVKMSDVQDMVTVYQRLSSGSDYVLHLGLTEAGGDVQGVTSSAAALALLLQQGIGDTIRVSLTPGPTTPRTREVEVCQVLLQSLGLRFFSPTVISCPGCGRTHGPAYRILAQDVREYVGGHIREWREQYPGVEQLKIAVMGCVVNGPGESAHADIGISLPGKTDEPIAPVYVDGKKVAILKGPTMKEEFLGILEKYIKERFKDARLKAACREAGAQGRAF